MLWKRGCVLAFRYVALALALALRVVALLTSLRIEALIHTLYTAFSNMNCS